MEARCSIPRVLRVRARGFEGLRLTYGRDVGFCLRLAQLEVLMLTL